MGLSCCFSVRPEPAAPLLLRTWELGTPTSCWLHGRLHFDGVALGHANDTMDTEIMVVFAGALPCVLRVVPAHPVSLPRVLGLKCL